MKKSSRTLLGVTLLEIMLVLAIAAMVIVMSIRYYQSASNNQKVASLLNSITGIVAAGEGLLGTTGSLGTANAGLQAYLPGAAMPSSPWGGPISITNQAANTYTINVPSVPGSVCTQIIGLLSNNNKLGAPGSCPGTMTIVVTE
jgi:Tfp pilus assembly major pilin PilA